MPSKAKTTGGAAEGRRSATPPVDARPQCEAATNQRRRCRNRCEPGRDRCLVHVGLAPDEPAAEATLVVIDRDGLPRKVGRYGALGDVVEADPNMHKNAVVPADPNRFLFVCRCGVASRGAYVPDHGCATPPDPWDGADRRRRLGLARGIDSAREPVLAKTPSEAPNNEKATKGPSEKSLPPAHKRPKLVRSAGGEPERTNDPESWLT
jgi:hypothetical protein